MTGRRRVGDAVAARWVAAAAVLVASVGAATVVVRVDASAPAATVASGPAAGPVASPGPDLAAASVSRDPAGSPVFVSRLPAPAPDAPADREPAPPPTDGSAAPSPDDVERAATTVDLDPTSIPRADDVPGRFEASVLPRLDASELAATAARVGIPERALAAYASAALHVREERPGCGLTWITLAGIGWHESHHGSFRGAQLLPDGSLTEPLVGIPLDGGPNVRAIPDTDGGRLDGDTTWDRAVGPMQFIPSTWARWATDANGDGVADPQHIDDAALAAARYLCASGGDLTQTDHWARAVRSYNRSDAYVRGVLDAANTYAARANGES